MKTFYNEFQLNSECAVTKPSYSEGGRDFDQNEWCASG